MGTRKTNGALEGHVDVKDAYRMAQNDIGALLHMIRLETRMHARHTKKIGLNFALVGDLAATRRSLVEVMAQFAQQDEQFVWKRVAGARKGKKT